MSGSERTPASENTPAAGQSTVIQYTPQIIPNYRLNIEILDTFLKEEFGDHNYQVEAEGDVFKFNSPQLSEFLLQRDRLRMSIEGDDRQLKRQFQTSLERYKEYPTNLIACNSYKYVRERYREQLGDAEKQMVFCDDVEDANVGIRELHEGSSQFKSHALKNVDQLSEHFGAAFQNGKTDPKCKFIFLEAESSRDPLKITREMLVYILTFEQVMPAILDFVFLFGQQDFPKDLYFSGFKHETCLFEKAKSVTGGLERSGRNFQICYSLKAPERSVGGATTKWDVRQTAVYHSFDVDTGRATWIFLKGNNTIEKRITEESETSQSFGPGSYSSAADCFTASLEPHLMLCEWARENWRWYIKAMEDDAQTFALHVRHVTVTTKLRESAVASAKAPATAEILPLRRQLTGRVSKAMQQVRGAVWPSWETKKSEEKMPVPQQSTIIEIKQPTRFTFNDLQRLYDQEEKASEALTILRADMQVVKMLKAYYEKTTNLKGFPANVRDDSATQVDRFMDRLDHTLDDLAIQESRLEALLRSMSNSRSLLLGLLEYYGADSSLYLAEKAQNSADTTQDLTVEMHYMAKTTGRSTVSMKAITVVTLLFLPGTFVSTFLSTDVVRFRDGTKVVSQLALGWFFIISVPLMIFIILVWIVMYNWSKYKEKIGTERAKLRLRNIGTFGSDSNV